MLFFSGNKCGEQLRDFKKYNRVHSPNLFFNGKLLIFGQPPNKYHTLNLLFLTDFPLCASGL